MKNSIYFSCHLCPIFTHPRADRGTTKSKSTKHIIKPPWSPCIFLPSRPDTEVDCKQCESVLEGMEAIDDEAEAAGIPVVKVEDRQLAKSVGVFAHPSLVIFRNYGEDAVIYSGDIKVR